MSDDFKNQTRKVVDVGGVRCPCCNKLHGKHRKMLNRIGRAKLKHSDNLIQNSDRF